MTIGIGAITKKSIIIGTDSLWTFNEEFVREHKTSKFLEIPPKYKSKVVIASSGQDRFTQIFERMLRDSPDLLDIKDKFSVADLVNSLQAEITKNGIGEAGTNELPEHNLGFLLASANTGTLWAIESDYGVIEFDDYVGIGSGAYLGESAMLALSKAKITGRDAIKLALETVIELHPYCGGRIEIKEISLEQKN